MAAATREHEEAMARIAIMQKNLTEHQEAMDAEEEGTGGGGAG